jgi:hypothetical protein
MIPLSLGVSENYGGGELPPSHLRGTTYARPSLTCSRRRHHRGGHNPHRSRQRHTHKSAAKLSYYMECFTLKTVGNDINAQASQGWTVRAMVDHESPEGQECLLVLFERETP